MTTDTPGESGLQVERTSLAWNRTALTAAALGATTLRAGITQHSVLDLLATGVSLTAGIVMYVCSRWRSPRGDVGVVLVSRTAVLLAATSAVLAGLVATAALTAHALSY